jgi:hypothetical protein
MIIAIIQIGDVDNGGGLMRDLIDRMQKQKNEIKSKSKAQSSVGEKVKNTAKLIAFTPVIFVLSLIFARNLKK